MIETKRSFVPRCRPLTLCAPAVILLLSACAALESEDGVARETDDAKPAVFAVALADDPAKQDPAGRPVVVSDGDGATQIAHEPETMQEPPARSESGVGEVAVVATTAATATTPTTAPIASIATTPTPAATPAIVAAATTAAPATTPPAIAQSTPANPQANGPTQPPPNDPTQNAPATTNSQPLPQSSNPSQNDALREQVFGLATSGGAVRALDEAKARPDVFSPVDIAQIEELAIRQQVRGGRDKARAMTSSDRFDALDAALRQADDFDARLPQTPEYAQVRASLAGDRTVAYAARGRMTAAVAVFETIPPGSDVSIEALSAAGDAYSYLQQPDRSEQVYRRAIEKATATTADQTTGGFQYGTRTRLIDLREGLFYALTDQNKFGDAQRVLDDIHASLPPAGQVQQWDAANDDYLRYYRLRAQYLIYIGQSSAGLAELQRLEEQVPFSAEVRNAQADATLGESRTRRARDMYLAALTDHPDNVEALSGLGRTSLALGDYANARRIDNAFDDTFPENGSVRGFKRDYQAFHAPVLTVEVNGEHGNSALADNAFSLETFLYSPPIYDNWRVFAHTFYGHADTDIGNVTRTRPGVGGDYRNGPLTVSAEVTHSVGSDPRTGGNGEVSYAFNDYLSATANVDSDANSLPWKAYVNHIWGKTAQASFNFTDTDRRSASLSYSVGRYSDSNFHQEITATGTQRVFTAPNQFVNVTLTLDTSSNSLTNPSYYAPGRDYTAEVTAMHQWSIWRSGEKALQQRIYLSAGAYNERGFGTSGVYSARLEHAWTFSRDITLTYGLSVQSQAYDGSRELSETAYAALTIPF
jgi:biofilm PGA synthesis protein PgaA